MADLFLPVLYGSVREARVSFPVAEFVTAELAKRPGVKTHLYDPRDLPFSNLVRREWDLEDPDPRVAPFVEAMARADGFVIVTPEYNYGFPGALKNLLDSLYDEWNRKPFGLVGAGGMAGGARAIDGLRIVLPGVAAISVPASVLVPSVATEFTAAGPNDPEKWRKRLAPMFESLVWYARALQLARQTTPP
jgi:NAD(P)H-dependent FMN reductase